MTEDKRLTHTLRLDAGDIFDRLRAQDAGVKRNHRGGFSTNSVEEEFVLSSILWLANR